MIIHLPTVEQLQETLTFLGPKTYAYDIEPTPKWKERDIEVLTMKLYGWLQTFEVVEEV